MTSDPDQVSETKTKKEKTKFGVFEIEIQPAISDWTGFLSEVKNTAIGVIGGVIVVCYTMPPLCLSPKTCESSTLQSITDMHGIPINQMPQRLAHQTHLDCYSQGQKI